MARTYRGDSRISATAGALSFRRHFRRYLGEQLLDSTPVSDKSYCPAAAGQIVLYPQRDQPFDEPAQLFALGQRRDNALVSDERRRKVCQQRYAMRTRTTKFSV